MKETMNWSKLEGNWKQLRGKAKERWGKLTDDELTTIAGKREQLEGAIRKRYGVSKEQAEEDVASFARECGC